MDNGKDFDWESYKQWLKSKYSKHYVDNVFAYTRKYLDCFYDVSKITVMPNTNKDNVIDALIAFSKYMGCYEQFKQKLTNYDIKRHKQNCIESFLRIFAASDSDILDWYSKAITALRPNERLFLKFTKLIGARKEECINSFNLIIQLQKENKLSEYYNKELSCLMHFKYGNLFLRIKKNLFISFVPETLINEIASSTSITYPAIRKRLNHNHLTVRISELRDYYGTYLLQHGILEQEVNLLQGRIPVSVFCKHYWSPKLGELRNRVFKAIEHMEVQQQQPITTTQ
ncbi:MAG: integrase [Candidatus Bathyarchaeia archaeon]|jgi:intergrase/recombinase